MDVNRLLKDLRADVQEGLYRVYREGMETADTDLLLSICEMFDNLDNWMQTGGFSPDDWKV